MHKVICTKKKKSQAKLTPSQKGLKIKKKNAQKTRVLFLKEYTSGTPKK